MHENFYKNNRFKNELFFTFFFKYTFLSASKSSIFNFVDSPYL